MVGDKLPEGVRIELKFYAISEDGLEASVSLGTASEPDMAALQDNLNGFIGNCPNWTGGSTWRAMTSEEIKSYMDDQEADDEDTYIIG